MFDWYHYELVARYNDIQMAQEINYGMQYRFVNGAIVNVYNTTKYSIGGKKDTQLNGVMFTLRKEFYTLITR